MGDVGYPLDLLTPVRHVATELDRVSPETLSSSELAASYTHPNPSDITRVRSQEGCATKEDAVTWLMERAIIELKDQVEQTGDGYQLTREFGKLRYERKLLHKIRNDHAQFRAPFDPMTGRFSDNVRRHDGRDKMDELRESMRSFGWLQEFPAIKDERGVVLVGHRRLAVAEELDITPVVSSIKIGDGDEADAKRFALAVASNLGSKPFTAEERKDLAEYLYGEREWTMQRIADALKVSQSTVQRDLESLPGAGKPDRPKGGRPKGSAKRKMTPELDDEVRDLVANDQPISRPTLAAKHNVGERAVRDAQERAIGAIAERERQRQQGQQGQPRSQPSEHAHRWVCAECGNVAPSDS
jgi:ParB-like chromosome segregation protein Spo0J